MIRNTRENMYIAIYFFCNAFLVQLRGFKLMIQLQPRIMMSSNPKYTDNTTKAQYNFSRGIIRIPLEVKTIGRYVSVEMTNHFQQNPPIVICEVKVLGGQYHCYYFILYLLTSKSFYYIFLCSFFLFVCKSKCIQWFV